MQKICGGGVVYYYNVPLSHLGSHGEMICGLSPLGMQNSVEEEVDGEQVQLPGHNRDMMRRRSMGGLG